MPVPRDPLHAPDGAASPVGRAAASAARAARRREAMAADLLLPDEARLDERTRAGAKAMLLAAIAAQERALRLGAAKRLAAWDGAATAARLAEADAPVAARLLATGVLADPELAAELIGCAELAQLAHDLPASAGAPDRPSLLVRLAECPEPPVAQAATVMLEAANRARNAAALPAGLSTRLAWWVAAALAEMSDDLHLALALAEATDEWLAADDPADEGRAALRLAAAIAARPDELGELLLESLGDRQPALFAALVAEALALGFADVREMMLDRDGARLALLLRAAGLDRAAIARIGVALAAADPRRDLERFADELDAVAALPPADAAAALAPLALPAAFRRARRELDGRA